ncbi:LOW QUALITY PROTEIN: hypothetical protein HID58_048586, partial [Brassica napus]
FFLLIPDGVYGLSAIVFEGYEKRLEHLSILQGTLCPDQVPAGRNTHLHACKIVSPFYNDHLMGNDETNKACLCCLCSVPSPLATATTMSTQESGKTGSMTDKSGIRNAISTILVTLKMGLGAQETVAVHLSVGINEYKPEISVGLEDYKCIATDILAFRPREWNSHTFEKFGKFCGSPRS